MTTHADYTAYLLSPQWQRKRELVLSRAGFRCEQCGRKGRLQVHHTHYKDFGHEGIDSLEALCPFHHFTRHPGRTARGIAKKCLRWLLTATLLALAAWVLYPRWGAPGVLFVAFIGLMMVKAGRKHRG